MYDYEDDDVTPDLEDANDDRQPADEPVTMVLTGYNAERIDEIVEARLEQLVRGAVDSKVAKRIDAAIAAKIEALSTDALTERLTNELDLCIEEGWKRTDTWGKTCGNTVTLKDRLLEYLNENHHGKQRGEAVLRSVIDKKTSAAINEFVEQLREQLKADTDAMIRKKVDADATIAAQLKETVLDLFGAGKK